MRLPTDGTGRVGETLERRRRVGCWAGVGGGRQLTVPNLDLLRAALEDGSRVGNGFFLPRTAMLHPSQQPYPPEAPTFSL